MENAITIAIKEALADNRLAGLPAPTVVFDEKWVAEHARLEIYGQLGEATKNEVVLEASWMRLGKLLAEFKAAEHWRLLGYETFPKFMLELRDKYNRGKTQLWNYLTVAEKLLPLYPAEKLEAMGISKAMEFARALGNSKTVLPQEIIDKATEQGTTIKKLRGLIGVAQHGGVAPEQSSWFDWGGSFLTAGEKEEIKEAIRVTIRLLGIAPHVPEHIQRKEIFLAWAKEFYGTYASEVFGPAADGGGADEAEYVEPADTGAY